MKKIKKQTFIVFVIVICIIAFFLFTFISMIIFDNRSKSDIYKYINENIDFKVDSCKIVKDSSDEDYIYTMLNCSNSNTNQKFEKWNKLPMNDDLSILVYGNNKDFEGIAKSLFNIPKVKAGYYLFVNKELNSKSIDEINRYTIMIFDKKTNYLYYFEQLR